MIRSLYSSHTGMLHHSTSLVPGLSRTSHVRAVKYLTLLLENTGAPAALLMHRYIRVSPNAQKVRPLAPRLCARR